MEHALPGTHPFGREEQSYRHSFADHYPRQWQMSLGWMKRELTRMAGMREAERDASEEGLQRLRTLLRNVSGVGMAPAVPVGPVEVGRCGEDEYSYRLSADGGVDYCGSVYVPPGAERVRGIVIGLAVPGLCGEPDSCRATSADGAASARVKAQADACTEAGFAYVVPVLAGTGRTLADDPQGRWYAYPDRTLLHYLWLLCGGALAGAESAELAAVAAAFRTGAAEALPVALDAGHGCALSALAATALYPGTFDAVWLDSRDAERIDHQEDDRMEHTIWGFHRHFDLSSLLLLSGSTETYIRHAESFPNAAAARAALRLSRSSAAPGKLVLCAGEEVFDVWSARLSASSGFAFRRAWTGANAGMFAPAGRLPAAAEQGGLLQRWMRGRVDYVGRLYEQAGAERRRRYDTAAPGWTLEDCRQRIAASLNEVMGMQASRLPKPIVKSQRDSTCSEALYDQYRILLEAVAGVETAGYLLLPKGEGPFPAVICQHGLMGRPDDWISPGAGWVYGRTAHMLAGKGFAVYVPFMNWGWGGNPARDELAKHAYALGMTPNRLESAQLAGIVDFLQSRPEVVPDRIGFYGLSYGGHAGVWLGAVEPRLRAVVVSGHFNDWHRKLVSLEAAAPAVRPTSFVSYDECLDMFNFNIARHLGHAECVARFAPRPFMAENGLRDAVTPTAWVEDEFARVRDVYARAGEEGAAQLAHFDGPHRVWAEESVQFLRKHLMQPSDGKRREAGGKSMLST